MKLPGLWIDREFVERLLFRFPGASLLPGKLLFHFASALFPAPRLEDEPGSSSSSSGPADRQPLFTPARPSALLGCFQASSAPTLLIIARPWWISIARFQWALSVSLTIWIPAPPRPYEILTPTGPGQSHGSMPRSERGAQNFEERRSGFYHPSNPSKPLKGLKGIISLQINPHSVITAQLHAELSLHMLGCGCGYLRRRIKAKCFIEQEE